MNNLSWHDPDNEGIEDCDCHRCALIYRDRYKAALASVSAEISLPPTMGPGKGELKRFFDNAKEALDLIRNAPKAISAGANFEKLTWTFQVAPDCRIGTGAYALVWLKPDMEGV